MPGVVVVAQPATATAPARNPPNGIVSQKDLRFVPDILVVRTGTAIEFPNADPVRHQVYSFSSAKKFQLSLYSGSAHAPVVFDKPGLVTLGCNIHDSMIGYVYVTDSPWFGRTDRAGEVRLHELPAGSYTVHLWHPLIRDGADQLMQTLVIGSSAPPAMEIRLRKSIATSSHGNGASKTWADY